MTALWWAWHLPVALVPGTLHHEVGLFTVDTVLDLGTHGLLLVVVPWTFRRTGGHLLGAVVPHYAYNVVGHTLVLLGPAYTVNHLLLLAAGAVPAAFLLRDLLRGAAP